MGRILLTTSCAAVAVLAVACGGKDSAGGTGTPTTAATSSAGTGTPDTKLPLCGDVVAPPDSPPDCRLTSTDSAGESFTVHHTTENGQATVTIQVIGRDGARRQTIVEHDNRIVGQPVLRDLDADGRDELVVPLSQGVVNSRFVIYHATDGDPEFVNSGELFGLGPERTPSGYVAIEARDGAAQWDIDFATFQGAQLRRVVTARVDLSKDAAGKVSGACTVADAGGLAATGLTPDEATKRFCAEPMVLRHLPS
ncbi:MULTISPECIES: hypothetical protein [unclassified Nocardia]|uniref:hypothetical protein n=1 Tax=unclassified Nocardia TaxID=2637762 RepID=UPI001CE3D465|nr:MULTISPECIES: hypothetical protein [unclassified Nocardia]